MDGSYIQILIEVNVNLIFVTFHVLQGKHRDARQTYDKIIATIYGQCVGDALGLMTENMSKAECKKVSCLIFSVVLPVLYILNEIFSICVMSMLH